LRLQKKTETYLDCTSTLCDCLNVCWYFFCPHERWFLKCNYIMQTLSRKCTTFFTLIWRWRWRGRYL